MLSAPKKSAGGSEYERRIENPAFGEWMRIVAPGQFIAVIVCLAGQTNLSDARVPVRCHSPTAIYPTMYSTTQPYRKKQATPGLQMRKSLLVQPAWAVEPSLEDTRFFSSYPTPAHPKLGQLTAVRNRPWSILFRFVASRC